MAASTLLLVNRVRFRPTRRLIRAAIGVALIVYATLALNANGRPDLATSARSVVWMPPAAS